MLFSTICFEKIVMEFSFNSTSDELPGIIQIETFQKEERNCTSWFAVSSRYSWHRFNVFAVGKSQVEILSWKDGEVEDVQAHAWMLFENPEGILGDLEDVVATIGLFAGPNMVQNNVQVAEEYFQFEFKERPVETQWNVTLDKSQIESGDYFGIRRWDGLDPMIMVGTGSMTGHTAIALWMDGELYVCESTGQTNYWPGPYGIIRTPYTQWIQQAIAAHYDVAVLKLSPEARQLFDEDAAIKFFKDNTGYPYGYHNFIFGWIDTIDNNYPYPLDKELLIPLALLVEAADYATAESLWLLGFNFRLGTTGLGMHQILDECDRRGITLFELVTWPEQDSWMYPDGPSMVCDVFVISVYRAAGLFPNVTFQATELHPRDSYQLKIYDTSAKLPAACKDDLPYCQLIGRYVLEMYDYSTISPYDSMFESCGALPHDYVRSPWPC